METKYFFLGFTDAIPAATGRSWLIAFSDPFLSSIITGHTAWTPLTPTRPMTVTYCESTEKRLQISVLTWKANKQPFLIWLYQTGSIRKTSIIRNLPHSKVLQNRVSFTKAGGQGLPAPTGYGLAHSLVLDWTPPPHDSVQVFQSLHSVQPPSTAEECER